MGRTDILALAGRVFLATIFLASAFGKITNFEATTQYMAAHGMPLVSLLCAAAVVLEIAGGLSLVLGYQARWGAMALVVFMVPTTLIFHLSPDQRVQLLKNMAILGGLLEVGAFGSGAISLDAKR